MKRLILLINKKRLIIILMLIIFPFSISADQENFKWKNISGKWNIKKEGEDIYLIEEKAKCFSWNYSEIINYNSIKTFNPISKYSSIKFSMRIANQIKSPVEVMTFFALKHYRDFYAFKLVDNDKLKEIQFINSKIKDPALEITEKNNFNINNLKSNKFNFEYNKKYIIEIKVKNKKAELFIDNKKEFEFTAEEELDNGNIGFSVRNAKLIIDDVKIYNDKNIVFEDDFNIDLIKRNEVTAKIEKKE